MMTATKFKILLAAFLLCTAAGAQAGPDVVEQIGGVPIAIPAPQGFTEASRQAPPLRQIAQTMTPPTNRLLALFVTDQDIRLTMRGNEPGLNQYYMVQTAKKTEALRASPEDFSNLTARMRDQMQATIDRLRPRTQGMLDSAAQELSAEAGRVLTVKMGETKVLGIDDDSPSSFGWTMASKYESNLDGLRKEVPMVMAGAVILVKGKIVFAYTLSIYRAPADLAWVRKESRSLVGRILSAN